MIPHRIYYPDIEISAIPPFNEYRYLQFIDVTFTQTHKENFEFVLFDKNLHY